MADLMRYDRNVFVTKDDATKFAREHKIYDKKLYLTRGGGYVIKSFSKLGEKCVGQFRHDFNDIILDEHTFEVPIKKKGHAEYGLRSGSKPIDGKKFMQYIIDNDYDKKSLCALVHKSRSFINDACKYNRMDILCLEIICDYMKVPRDYFDLKPEITEITDQQEIKDSSSDPEVNTLHDDLMVLIASSKKIEALLIELIDVWRN